MTSPVIRFGPEKNDKRSKAIMANNNDEFENYLAEIENGDLTESEGIKSLRKAYNKLKKTHDEATTELTTLRAKERENTVSQVLTEKGLDAKVAKFIPEGADVEEWLTENGSLFTGVSQGGQPQQQQQGQQQAQQIPQVAQDFADLQSLMQDTGPAFSADAPELAGLMKAAEEGNIGGYMSALNEKFSGR